MYMVYGEQIYVKLSAGAATVRGKGAGTTRDQVSALFWPFLDCWRCDDLRACVECSVFHQYWKHFASALQCHQVRARVGKPWYWPGMQPVYIHQRALWGGDHVHNAGWTNICKFGKSNAQNQVTHSVRATLRDRWENVFKRVPGEQLFIIWKCCSIHIRKPRNSSRQKLQHKLQLCLRQLLCT